MRLSLAAALLLLAACRATGPQSLEDQSVRVELGRRVTATLTDQEHYFANDYRNAVGVVKGIGRVTIKLPPFGQGERDLVAKGRSIVFG